MTTALAIAITLLAIAALVAWVLAIHISYRIERLRTPDAPRRRLFTNVIASLFRSGASTPEEAPLRRRLGRRLTVALACFIALGALSFTLPLLAPPQPALATFPMSDVAPAQLDPALRTEVTDGQPLTGASPPGTTLAYTRSNQDGTMPEHILVHIVSPTELHVAKMVAPCTDAAYVTAIVDPATHETVQLTGGRLQRDGSQLPQAWLTLDPETRRLAIRLGKPDAPVSETHDAPSAPWRMYDFDLAEFALAGPPPKGSFSFGLALALPGAAPPLVEILGEAHADLLVASKSDSEPYALYTVTGAPFGADGGGVLKLDPLGGHVINARLDRPNHPGYDDFMLVLDAVHRFDGDIFWRQALLAHWKGC